MANPNKSKRSKQMMFDLSRCNDDDDDDDAPWLQTYMYLQSTQLHHNDLNRSLRHQSQRSQSLYLVVRLKLRM